MNDADRRNNCKCVCCKLCPDDRVHVGRDTPGLSGIDKRYGLVGVHTQLSLNCRFTGKFGKTDPSPADQEKYDSEERCALRTKLLNHAQRCVQWQKLRNLPVIRAELVLGDRAKTALLPQSANVEQAQQLNAMSHQLGSLQKSQNAGFSSVKGAVAEAADDIKQAVTSAVNFAKVEAVASRIEISVGIDVADGEDLEDRLLRILELLNGSSKKATDGFKRVRSMSDLRIPVKIIFWLAHPRKKKHPGFINERGRPKAR